MDFISLTCPQCGGSLPRQARWRMVHCPYCNSLVTRSDDVVQSARFHQSLLNANESIPPAPHCINISGTKFRVLAPLGGGDHSEVYLAERMNRLPERVIIKCARHGVRSGQLSEENKILRALQSLETSGSPYFSQRLPQPVDVGNVDDTGREVLVLRQPVGFWGSLEDVLHYHQSGVDARHAVWIWRRILDVLSFIHDNGWSHGNLHPGHLLVHPSDHGILIIGWHQALQLKKDSDKKVRDLKQSAWSIRALLSGNTDDPGFGSKTPAPLVEVLKHASEDTVYCASLGAAGIDDALKSAAFESFGSPVFVPFCPVP
jgi:serine/threonine protein kinase